MQRCRNATVPSSITIHAVQKNWQGGGFIAMGNMLLDTAGQEYNLTSKNHCQEKPMTRIATTKMSSKGQVVIPEEIRQRLKLKAGAQFVVVGENDVVILKSIAPPASEEFDGLVAEARRQAKVSGLKKVDISRAVAKVRGRQ
jgi:AbrB family looped-hinge helix DNA binding protein